MSRHPVGHPQRSGQEGTVAVLHQDQGSLDQRTARGEPVAGQRAGRGKAAQLEAEADRSPPPADVVLQVAVEALEARVSVGRQGDQEQLQVELIELEAAGQASQPEVGARLLGPVGLLLHLSEGGLRLRIGGRRPGRPLQQPLDVGR